MIDFDVDSNHTDPMNSILHSTGFLTSFVGSFTSNTTYNTTSDITFKITSKKVAKCVWALNVRPQPSSVF